MLVLGPMYVGVTWLPPKLIAYATSVLVRNSPDLRPPTLPSEDEGDQRFLLSYIHMRGVHILGVIGSISHSTRVGYSRHGMDVAW